MHSNLQDKDLIQTLAACQMEKLPEGGKMYFQRSFYNGQWKPGFPSLLFFLDCITLQSFSSEVSKEENCHVCFFAKLSMSSFLYTLLISKFLIIWNFGIKNRGLNVMILLLEIAYLHNYSCKVKRKFFFLKLEGYFKNVMQGKSCFCFDFNDRPSRLYLRQYKP